MNKIMMSPLTGTFFANSIKYGETKLFIDLALFALKIC